MRKAFGEKIVALRPSWRGGAGAASARAGGQGTGGKVGGLIKSLSTVEGRNQHRFAGRHVVDFWDLNIDIFLEVQDKKYS